MGNKYQLKKLKELINDDSLYRDFIKHKCLLAGGAIRSIYMDEEVKDLDIYMRSKKDAFYFLETLKDNSYKCISQTNKSIVMSRGGAVKINVILFKFFNSLREVFDCFDFTCCMGGFDFEKESFEVHKDFFKDNLTKTIRYSKKSMFPIGALLRIKKYTGKGMHASDLEIAKIALQCTKLKIETIEDLEEQISGMYGCNLKELYGDEPFSLDRFLEKAEQIDVDLKVEPRHINNWIAHENWNDIISYTKINDKVYCMIDDKIYDESPMPEKDLPEEAIFKNIMPLKLYKWVRRKDDGTFNSFMKSSFKYKIGEEVEAESYHGIHCGLLQYADSLTYCPKNKNQKDRDKTALIELIVNNDKDVIKIQSGAGIGTVVKKAFVSRECPEEAKTILNKEKKKEEEDLSVF